MESTSAVIRKVGNEYVIFSKKGKRLGSEPTLEAAKKRLKQIEFFKHKGKSAMSDFQPDELGTPSQDNVKAVTPIQTGRVQMSKVGTIAGRCSPEILDTREHFPIENENQAKSAIHRVGSLRSVPAWYSGDVESLQREVYLAVASRYPNIRIPVGLRLEAALANITTKTDPTPKGKAVAKAEAPSLDAALEVLARKVGDTKPSDADGKVPEVDIQNPEVNPSKVPGIPRPTLASLVAKADFNDRKAIATTLLDLIKEKQESLKNAAKVANRLGGKGLSGKEFQDLMLFLQEDILHELLRKGTTASSDKMKQVVRNRRKS